MDFAIQKLDLSLSHIHQLTAAQVVGDASDQPQELEPNLESQQLGSNDGLTLRSRGLSLGRTSQSEQGLSSGRQSGGTTGLSDTSHMPLFFEDAILNAISDEPLLLNSVSQQPTLFPSFFPESFAFDAEGTTPRTLEYDHQHLE
jgi:hypothetical protein